MKPCATLHLDLPAAAADGFIPLMGTGVGIVTRTGIPLMSLLCDQLGIEREYIERRVQTVFVNGRAVDHLDQVTLAANAVVALSAAMPGLVGATFRRQGLLAGFRKDITHDQKASPQGTQQDTVITLKLFNLVARELALHVLRQRIWAMGHRLSDIMADLRRRGDLEEGAMVWNGAPLSVKEVTSLRWPDDWVELHIDFSD